MTTRWGPGEPAAGPWRVAPVDELVRLLWAAAGGPTTRPRVVAVDGRSAAGKTTVAALLQAAVPGSGVLHTDDIAWYESYFGWEQLLVDGVLGPCRRGEAVSFRPPAWDERGREGAIVVPAACPLLLVEGVGVGRRSLVHHLDALIWVQADMHTARQRGILRDAATHEARDPVAFWDEWQAEEVPLLNRERPWQHAGLVVSGTPTLPHDPLTEVVVAAPPRQAD